MARPPRIGVTTRTNDKSYLDRWARNYYWAILWAGGDPILLTPETALLPPDEQIAQLDGLFLTGGGDVHPRYFNQPVDGAEPEEIHDARDELELPLIQAALAADLPVLGVCRGIQVLNVAAGGGLLQHVDGHRSPADRGEISRSGRPTRVATGECPGLRRAFRHQHLSPSSRDPRRTRARLRPGCTHYRRSPFAGGHGRRTLALGLGRPVAPGALLRAGAGAPAHF